MSLFRRQQRVLGGIEEALSRSDPGLASMMAVFVQLTAGEEMPGDEQLRAPGLRRVRTAMCLAAAAAAGLIMRVAVACGRAISAAVALIVRLAVAGARAVGSAAAAGAAAAAGPHAPAPRGDPGRCG
jgi:hypothetical protein